MINEQIRLTKPTVCICKSIYTHTKALYLHRYSNRDMYISHTYIYTHVYTFTFISLVFK